MLMVPSPDSSRAPSQQTLGTSSSIPDHLLFNIIIIIIISSYHHHHLISIIISIIIIITRPRPAFYRLNLSG